LSAVLVYQKLRLKIQWSVFAVAVLAGVALIYAFSHTAIGAFMLEYLAAFKKLVRLHRVES
jgi:apolipoprotein N-acyltransferase